MDECDATYLVTLLIPGQPSSWCGQYDTQISYVFLPNKSSKGIFICSSITFPEKSSKYGTVHPPYLKPLEVSSSGPPGACITPSRVKNSRTISFLIYFIVIFYLTINSNSRLYLGSCTSSR